MNSTRIADLAREIVSPAEGWTSRTIYRDEQVKVLLFAFAPGAVLAEHSAPLTAILQILQGEAVLTLGEETWPAQAGAWIHMPARLTHSIQAKTPLIALLSLLK
jgi:quercetin dioxygenase-like cupin family protein